MSTKLYRSRIAPTPTGLLHLGHAQTFYLAQKRCIQKGGEMILRVEDLDAARCKPEFCQSMIEDLKWFGFKWTEGPDIGGFYGPYAQSERLHFYHHTWVALNEANAIYPSPHSRKDVENALNAPHEGDKEIIFPTSLRPDEILHCEEPGNVNWRFKVPDGLVITFIDNRLGKISYEAGKDFGDFLVWRKDGFPSYELSVVSDDYTMGITEVVRGEDLLLSTARQLLLYDALDWKAPEFYHCPLVRDSEGQRLAKRDKSLSLRTMREEGWTPDSIRKDLFQDR